MLLGVLAVPVCGGPLAFAAGALAIVTGHIARRQVRAGEGIPDDNSLITIGLIGGYSMVVLSVAGVLLVVGLVAAGYLGQDFYFP